MVSLIVFEIKDIDGSVIINTTVVSQRLLSVIVQEYVPGR